VRVVYTEPNSPAEQAGIPRGAEILFADGVNVRTGSDVDALIEALYPESVGEEHTFIIQEVGAS